MSNNQTGLYYVLRDKLQGARGRGPRTATGPGAPKKLVPPRRRGHGKASGNGKAVGSGPVDAQREQLSRRFVELQWDLGGLTYEMASRDHFRMDLLLRKAAELQKVDSELGQLERLVKMKESGAAGACPNCSALQARGAVFCWQCGHELTPASKPGEASA